MKNIIKILWMNLIINKQVIYYIVMKIQKNLIKRMLLFLFGCMSLRIGFVYLAHRLSKKNLKYIYYYLNNNLLSIEETFEGSTIKHSSKTKLLVVKIKLPKNKQLIEDMEPTFQEIEQLQEEVKNADTLYHQYLEELGQEAIKQ